MLFFLFFEGDSLQIARILMELCVRLLLLPAAVVVPLGSILEISLTTKRRVETDAYLPTLSQMLLPVDCSCPPHVIAGQWGEQRSHYVITLTLALWGVVGVENKWNSRQIQDKRKINAIRFNPLAEKRENTWKYWPSQIVCSQSENRTQIKGNLHSGISAKHWVKDISNSWPNFIQINDLSQPKPTRHSQPSRVAFVKVTLPTLPTRRPWTEFSRLILATCFSNAKHDSANRLCCRPAQPDTKFA